MALFHVSIPGKPPYCPTNVLSSIGVRMTTAFSSQKSEKAFDSLREEVLKVQNALYALASESHIRALLAEMDEGDRILAVGILATSNNLTCQHIAIEFQPSHGKFCADDLMWVIRYKLPSHEKIAVSQTLQSLLGYAHDWYTKAGALTPALDAEIQQGLDLTSWVNRTV